MCMDFASNSPKALQKLVKDTDPQGPQLGETQSAPHRTVSHEKQLCTSYATMGQSMACGSQQQQRESQKNGQCTFLPATKGPHVLARVESLKPLDLMFMHDAVMFDLLAHPLGGVALPRNFVSTTLLVHSSCI